MEFVINILSKLELQASDQYKQDNRVLRLANEIIFSNLDLTKIIRLIILSKI